jgi:hypothetical protein
VKTSGYAGYIVGKDDMVSFSHHSVRTIFDHVVFCAYGVEKIYDYVIFPSHAVITISDHVIFSPHNVTTISECTPLLEVLYTTIENHNVLTPSNEVNTQGKTVENIINNLKIEKNNINK